MHPNFIHFFMYSPHTLNPIQGPPSFPSNPTSTKWLISSSGNSLLLFSLAHKLSLALPLIYFPLCCRCESVFLLQWHSPLIGSLVVFGPECSRLLFSPFIIVPFFYLPFCFAFGVLIRMWLLETKIHENSSRKCKAAHNNMKVEKVEALYV